MKKIIIISVVAIVGVILLIVGLKWGLASKGETETEILPTPTVVLPTISDDISVELLPRGDKRVVALRIKGLTSDIESVEYELTYLTNKGLPRGVLGKIATQGEKEIGRDDIVLGTCSSGKCVYDEGVTAIDLSLKFNGTKGSQIFQKTYSL